MQLNVRPQRNLVNDANKRAVMEQENKVGRMLGGLAGP